MSNKEEAWTRFASQIGAELSQGFSLFWHPKVVAKLNHWTITFDTGDVSTGPTGSSTVTRVTAPYSATNEWFGFEIHREGAFSKLGKALRIIQDIEVGYPELDREYIIGGDDESRVRELFANPRIRQLIRAISDIKFRGKAWELSLETPHDTTSVRQLRIFYELFVETLSQLRDIGAIH